MSQLYFLRRLKDSSNVNGYKIKPSTSKRTSPRSSVEESSRTGRKEERTLLKDWIYQGVHAGVALLEGITDIVKIKALIKAASKGIKEVITKLMKLS